MVLARPLPEWAWPRLDTERVSELMTRNVFTRRRVRCVWGWLLDWCSYRIATVSIWRRQRDERTQRLLPRPGRSESTQARSTHGQRPTVEATEDRLAGKRRGSSASPRNTPD
jgi:hypothetical protein